ncbi:hypothetical protein [Desulfogranum marinum]|uniref:hypothetical protein n=1 Tax=Desulfogranum marinum TaxID=453220 RepID=UPI0029C6D565|nr:hypothetical protein [Desulfogranum marinum]
MEAIVSSTAKISKNSDKKKEMSGLSPVNPFRSLLVHFGMLLGVDDFETIDSYQRGKMWLHSAWLHRQGAVWGLRVSLSGDKDEIRVTPGLAMDSLGRELYLESPACLDIGSWYEKHKDEPDLVAAVQNGEQGGIVCFDAHVAIRFKGCLARQVPALTEPCDNTGTTTAYSRIIETVELLLLPGKSPEWRTPPGLLPYHRLRLLFGLEEAITDANDNVVAADKVVLDARADILDLDPNEQPAAYLEAFRRFSALDEMDLTPAATDEGDAFSLFPDRDPALLPLADIEGITLTPAQNSWHVSSGQVDNTVRPVHVATSTIQELLCGPICSCISDTEEPETSGGGPDVPPEDADGPRIDPDKVTITEAKITFPINGDFLLENSVKAEGLLVTSFKKDHGWKEEKIESVEYNSNDKVVSVKLQDKLPNGTGTLVRLIVSGTGGFPFLDTKNIPLAGALGGPPGGKMNGNDFVFMSTVVSTVE